MTGAPLHSLKPEAQRQQETNCYTLPVGGGLRAWKKRPILELRSIIKQDRAASGKLFNSDNGKVGLKTTYPHPPPSH